MQEKLHFVPINNEINVALWELFSVPTNKHVLLTHGTFSTRVVLKSIVSYLTSKGYKCWIYEWRGHGASTSSKEKYDIETIASDFKIVFDALKNTFNIDTVHCIGHSGGGLALTMALINYPNLKDQILSISFFAVQSFGACTNKFRWIRMFLAKHTSKLTGKIYKQFVGGETDETYYFLEHWFNWNLDKTFIARSGIDYLPKMKKIKVPICAIFGEGDTFVAPKEGCLSFLNAFENLNNKVVFASKKKGFLEDYNHSRILHSSSAHKEIHPIVFDWIEQNN